jgi:restriction system protein
MEIPDFQSLMLPIMKIAQDGEEHTMREVRQRIGDELGLSDAERKQLLPSGAQPIFTNRIAWARAHLLMAVLLSKTGRGSFRITRRGQEVLASNPSSLNMRLLQQFPEYVEARSKGKTDAVIHAEPAAHTSASEVASPQERIELAFRELNNSLTTELRSKLAFIDPFRFEQVVLDLLVKMGYGGSKKEAAQVTQRTADEGIDGLINEDRLGLEVIYIQAKRWKHKVGRPEIQNFVGAIAGKKAGKGIFITTSDFHDNAREYAASLHQKLVLIDGRRLAELMIEHNIGVAPEQPYIIKKIDTDYFEES